MDANENVEVDENVVEDYYAGDYFEKKAEVNYGADKTHG